MDHQPRPVPKPFYKSLYFQVITAIVLGVLLGHFYPDTGASMKPLGDGFIKLIKMIIAPIIFCTVVVGIAGMEAAAWRCCISRSFPASRWWWAWSSSTSCGPVRA